MKTLKLLNNVACKTRWLTLLVLLFSYVGAQAADVQINYSDDWTATGKVSSGGNISITKSGVSVTSSKGYVNDSEVKIYSNGSTFTISSSIAMTQIVFNSGGGNDIKNNFSANVGTVNGSQRTWTGNATSVTFTVSQTVAWTRATVTIDSYVFAFSKNGATAGTVPDPIYKSSYSWSATIPYHAGVYDLRNADGCSFVGWNTDKNGNGADYVAGQTFYGSGNQTLYVKWGDCHYDVTYNLTGVTKTSGPTSVTSSENELEATFTVDNGYTIPVTATLYMGGYGPYGSSAGFEYDFDESYGVLTFGPSYTFDGDIVITITATEKPCTPISPTLTYSSAAMTVGDVASAPTLTGNTGGGTVTYSITSGSSHVSGLNTSTGVFTAASAGNITVQASIAQKTSGGTTYCANTATYNITIAAVTHTVTWHINGATSTTQVADGTKPTAPTVDVSDYCGDKFIGWTRCQISGSVGSESSVSAGGCGLIKTASGFPNVTADGVEYYAVFADENP